MVIQSILGALDFIIDRVETCRHLWVNFSETQKDIRNLREMTKKGSEDGRVMTDETGDQVETDPTGAETAEIGAEVEKGAGETEAGTEVEIVIGPGDPPKRIGGDLEIEGIREDLETRKMKEDLKRKKSLQDQMKKMSKNRLTVERNPKRVPQKKKVMSK